MRSSALRRIGRALSCAASLALAVPAVAQTPTPVGSQFQVNGYTTYAQRSVGVATAADGAFVVVWTSFLSPGTDLSSFSVQGRRYASDGTALAAQFQVNSYTTSVQSEPSVAAAADGRFVVVWSSNGSASDASGSSIQGQRYAADGTPQGAQFQVNSYTTNAQTTPSVGMADDGDFVVAWESNGASLDSSLASVQAQRYAADGTPQGAQFQVNTYTTSRQGRPSIGMTPEGDFVVAFESAGSTGTDTGSLGIQGQRYAADGTPQGAQFQVNTFTTSLQQFPSVSVADDGDFVVAWQSNGSSGTDTDAESIQAQRYAASGAAQGGEFQVNSFTTSQQRYPAVMVAPPGDFVVAWTSAGSADTDASGESIQIQRYNGNGYAQGAQLQVNSYTTSTQYHPALAQGAGADFVVVWTSSGSPGNDSNDTSIQGQRFTIPEPSVPALSASQAVLAAFLLALAAGTAMRRRA
jgi:hypothetical protein